MRSNGQLRIVHVRGSFFEMGRQIGEACRDEIRAMLAANRHNFESSYDEIKLTWEQAVLQAKKYAPFAQEYCPQYVEELRGIAAATDLAFDDLMTLNCTEEIVSDALYLGCTSIAVNADRTADGHVLVGHNEDWMPEDEPNTFLVHATPDDAPPFLAVTYGGLLPNIGFNAHGIAQCCDSVYPTDVRLGVPRSFVARGVLAATSIRDAVQRTLLGGRAAGYNHLIADRNGELYNVEVSATQFALIYGGIDGWIAHANHYQTPQMKAIEADPHELIGSQMRANRASRLLSSQREHSPETFRGILSDHVNYPHSICAHTVPEDSPFDRQKTICTLIMDLTTLELQACWGNPCENTFDTFRLEV